MLEKIGDAYENNPIIRALIQLAIAPVPYGIGSAINEVLSTSVNNMREQRLRVFFDELANGSRELTQETIKEVDFLHAYFSTLKAAVNTRRSEKIRLFARLLRNAALSRQLDTDQFEEAIQILDDLSLRELAILAKLNLFESTHSLNVRRNADITESGIYLQRANEFWEKFQNEVEKELRILPEELLAILSRLNRTGLYQTITGTFFGNTGEKGHLTPLFKQFSNWLNLQDVDTKK